MSERKTMLDYNHRVLDLCEGRGHLCGKILGDLGADVIQIEKPGGDPTRNLGPFVGDLPDPEKSLWWFAFNVNKRGITLNLESADGREIFTRLVRGADFVIESYEPGYLESLHLGYGDIERINPRTIMVSLSGFGQTGPYAQYKAPDIVLMSLGGQAFMAGDSDRPPVQISYPHAWSFAGLHGCMGAMNAHYWREMTGEGQHVDASVQTGVIWTNMWADVHWDLQKINTMRGGAIRRVDRVLPDGTKNTLTTQSTFPCKDGNVYFLLAGGFIGAPIMQALVNWMDEEGVAPEWMKTYDWLTTFDFSVLTQEAYDGVVDAIVRFFMTHTMNELYEESLKRRLMLVPIGTPKSLFEDQQLVFRNFWTKIEHPELNATLTYPAWPMEQSECPWQPRRRPPRIGEHNKEIYGDELGFSLDELAVLKANNVI